MISGMGCDQPYRDDDMLTRVQLAQALNVSTRTVDKWLAEGTAPRYTRLPGGMLRFRWADVVTWRSEHEVDG
jgi:excisionase family DNA binding protein